MTSLGEILHVEFEDYASWERKSEAKEGFNDQEWNDLIKAKLPDRTAHSRAASERMKDRIG